MIANVTQEDFEANVIERSREVPVVVDFWAEWCGPCRALGPAIESEVTKRGGQVELAKVDVDSNPALAQAFGIRGIPDVRAFRDGKIVAQFTGAIPPAQISAFLDSLLPSEADVLAQAGDEASLRAALETDPQHSAAAIGLARILLARGETDEARTLLEERAGADFAARGLLARIELEAREGASGNGDGPTDAQTAIAAWTEGDVAQALELFQQIIESEADPERRDLVRRIMVAIFTELGDDPLATEHRRRLAAALN
ncbi:MAG TPA: tetratricopeptide repeat protein [Solirubrobacterales bacterium]|nr:tetratricopeptide repeat protein [Solirubrobacterales bacterium]